MDRKKFKAPYFANIFSYKRSKNLEGYSEMDDLTLKLAQETEGFLGYEVTGDGSEHAIFISYWESMEAIQRWRENTVHMKAKAKGKAQWYEWYHSQICKVEYSAFHELK